MISGSQWMRHSEREWEKISRMRSKGINDFCVQNDVSPILKFVKTTSRFGDKISFPIHMGKRKNKKDRKMIPVYDSSNSQLQILVHDLTTTCNNRLFSLFLLSSSPFPPFIERTSLLWLFVCRSFTVFISLEDCWENWAGVQFIQNVLFDRLSNPESDEWSSRQE